MIHVMLPTVPSGCHFPADFELEQLRRALRELNLVEPSDSTIINDRKHIVSDRIAELENSNGGRQLIKA